MATSQAKAPQSQEPIPPQASGIVKNRHAKGLAQNLEITRKITKDTADVASRIQFTGEHVGVKAIEDYEKNNFNFGDEENPKTMFFFAEKEPTFYLSDKGTIPVKRHCISLNNEYDSDIIEYFRTHPRFGKDIFEGSMPKHIVEKLRLQELQTKEFHSEFLVNRELLEA